MSFRCERRGVMNNEMQSVGAIKVMAFCVPPKSYRAPTWCTVEIPDFKLQLPPARGQLTTVEGLLRGIVANLRLIMEYAWGDEEEVEDEAGEAGQVSSATEKNKEDSVKKAITIKLDDPSGNSFVGFLGSIPDPKWRSKRMREISCFEAASFRGTLNITGECLRREERGRRGRCWGSRRKPILEGNAKESFEDTLIRLNCGHYGYRDNEAYSGASNSEKGENHPEDRGPRRSKQGYPESGTCGLTIPEIDLVLQHGTLGGRLEGILEQVYEEPSEKVYMFGDSRMMVDEDRQAFQDVLKQLEEVRHSYL
ncbi:hypothetical protein EDD15DRAFT_2417474 [Pisolithus albus]|nr:hypothetical protein EDD15DRAFT_2417474 [Pisolithus albus]